MAEQFTPMEIAFLERMHQDKREDGFPPPAGIRCLKRRNTGVGRLIETISEPVVNLRDGSHGFGWYSRLSLEGVGLVLASVEVRGARVVGLDLLAEECDWTGEERPWVFRDDLEADGAPRPRGPPERFG